MKLNLPILDLLSHSTNILIAGMGGGFDVFSGLPLFLELEQRGFEVHLANLSFADIAGLNEGEALTDTLVGITGDLDGHFDYFPEYYLAQWLYDERNEDVTIWCFEKTGLRPLVKNYQVLVKHLGIDAIILVDGGVDSLMRGDEPEPGTLFEDTLSLLAVNELNHVPVRITSCLGLGIETELNYAYLFENIARLTKIGAFYGTCSLLRELESYQHFEEALTYVLKRNPSTPA